MPKTVSKAIAIPTAISKPVIGVRNKQVAVKT
jgi:hypothetical protein